MTHPRLRSGAPPQWEGSRAKEGEQGVGLGGVETLTKTWAMPFDGYLVGIGGHMHDGGISITIAHYTGDSSYPTEYTLRHGDIQTMGSTLDLALVAFLERLLPGRK